MLRCVACRCAGIAVGAGLREPSAGVGRAGSAAPDAAAPDDAPADGELPEGAPTLCGHGSVGTAGECVTWPPTPDNPSWAAGASTGVHPGSTAFSLRAGSFRTEG